MKEIEILNISCRVTF